MVEEATVSKGIGRFGEPRTGPEPAEQYRGAVKSTGPFGLPYYAVAAPPRTLPGVKRQDMPI
ncbi:hypothetical protein GCM10027280_01610 [Micromonospora polyrhachis]